MGEKEELINLIMSIADDFLRIKRIPLIRGKIEEEVKKFVNENYSIAYILTLNTYTKLKRFFKI